ncbi:MAG: acyl carrier protein [Coprococcus catus]|jgi:acyl carrier protein|nr:acyl carrier protein [Coprococcus catus]MDY5990396.1 acyl carrier protein [Coprococcus catus]
MLEKIKALLAEELGVNADEITAETSFKEDLGADSLDLFELVTNLEEEYSIEIPAEQLEEMTTVGKVIDYLKSIHIEA